ncbi:hypothetical protein EDF46_0982 [Frondihabitans sp. PhB188]|uniref:hypothetical protein n=1 Tax=Frondihabitans sp. PhB188 TaxID=2485200 RepID=UPI000F4A2781|nr:hypothetical protein [Frondihabitans sp. PhB188]ROQ41601.1 hypothetical protein EDF46_0982 [Frondihabitans sp. PhB188]
MSAPRLRRRALTITAALACTVGLALAGVGPAAAATPSTSTTSSDVSSRIVEALHEKGLGTLGSRSAVARALSDSGITSSASQSRTVAPSAVTPAPAGVRPAAEVDPNANRDAVVGQAVLGDELYGAGEGYNADASDLEHWTNVGWKPVAGSPHEIDSQVVKVGDAVYFTVTTYSKNYNASATLWSYDGTTFSALKKFDGEVGLAAAGSKLTLLQYTNADDEEDSFFEFNLPTATVSQYDGTTFTTPFESKKVLYAPIAIGDTQYFMAISITSSTVNSAIYRLDGSSLTRISTAPFGYSGVEWDGAFYYGGVSSKGVEGIYRFDGTATPTLVKTGVSFAGAYNLPDVGTFDGDLAFTGQKRDKTPTLYTFDGTTTASAGPIGTTDYDSAVFQEFDSKLFYAADGWDGTDTWIYDPKATTSDPATVVESSVPTITGTPTVGKVLTALGGDWTATAKLSYQWLSDGKAVKGATKARHRVTVGDYGHAISVRVTGSGPGFTPATQTSAETAKPLNGTIDFYPEISGKSKAGSTLTAKAYSLTPSTAKLTYRWYRNGTPIIGATKKTYKSTSGDVGKRLTVGVRASNTGYDDASILSDPFGVRSK